MKQMKEEYSEVAKEKLAAARQDERVLNAKEARLCTRSYLRVNEAASECEMRG